MIFILVLPMVAFGLRGTCFACKIWAANVIYSAKLLAGINFEVRGDIPNEPVIFACKHQSAWETAVFHLLVPRPVYVFKKELLYIPFFGLYLWISKQICLDRQAGASAIKGLIKQAQSRIEAGRSVIIFPEGTRKAVAAAPDYRAGIAAIYNNVSAPIVPVALNSGKFWGRDKFLKKSGTAIISFLPAIEMGLSKAEFMAKLESVIEAECQKL